MAKTSGAQPGNKNAAKNKEWEAAIRYAILNYVDEDVKRGQALKSIAKRVVKDALAGSKDAWQEIGNRLDGKPVQALVGADGGAIQFQEIQRVIVK